jgi:large repetitive protein
MRQHRNTSILCTLALLLAACGGGNITSGNGGTNLAPQASTLLESGSALGTAVYVSPNEALTFASSDPDGNVAKLKWVIDAGQPLERSGEYTGNTVKANIPFVLPNLNSGLHTLTLSVTDNSGTVTNSVTSFKVDALAPIISSVSVNGAPLVDGQVLSLASTDAATLKVSASDSRGGGDASASPTTVAVYVGDTLLKTGSAPLSYDLDLTKLLTPTTTVQTIRVVAVDSVLNGTVRSFTIQTATTTAPQERQPSPVLSVVGNAPYTGNMSVNASGNYDTASAIDRMILQITDVKGKVDNSTYVTPQSNATFSIDTTKFANGDLQLQLFAYTKTGLLGKSNLQTVQILNVNNPELAVASPANGASVTSPTVPVRVTLTSQGTAYNFDPTTLVIKLKDYRGQVIDTRSSTSSTPLTCVSSIDLATYTCDTSFDMAGLPADSYTIESTANATVTGATPAVQALKSVSTFKANTSSVNPPASTVRFPIAITSSTGVRTPALADSGSGFFATVSDDVAIKYVEARIVGPYAVGNIETDGTKQCQSSGTPLGTPIDVLLINVPGAALLPYQTQEVFIPNLDIEGSTYVPDNILKPDKTPAQRYDLRVTVADNEGNRNIQCVPVVIQRGLVRSVYATGTTTVPDPTSKKPTYSSGTWTISGIANTSRVVAVLYAKGVQVGTSFRAAVVGNTSVSQTFPEAGTYEVKWLIEDMSTGVVTTVNGGVINVGTNP